MERDRMPSRKSWTTEDEIEFIQSLHKHRWAGRNDRTYDITRLESLKRYKDSFRIRCKHGTWPDRFETGKVAEALDLEIQNEQRKPYAQEAACE